MSDNVLVLKSINQLMDHSFFIPSYQRGYRWTEKQVEDLLDDIWAFAIDPPKHEEGKMKPFYCLQPIVVKEKNGEENQWEVIDGQQRLTTIYLILENLKLQIEKDNKNLKRVYYETRDTTEEYLKKINEDFSEDNIDFYHIYNANETINKWFQEKANNTEYAAPKATFAPAFLTHTKVIWYVIKDGSDSYDIFTRLNIGKIELTNAELIKALFLKKWNNSEEIDTLRLKQLKVATEWDRIENRLQDDSFWYFINNELETDNPKYANRIEYIFDLMKDKPEDADDKYTFYEFNNDFEVSKNKNRYRIPDTESLWLEVKKYFLKFEEWYNDRELYHMIGFLITSGYDIKYILEPKEEDIKDIIGSEEVNIKTKTAFKQFLKSEIKKAVAFNIEKLDYGNSNIKTVLLLFNIQTILSNNGSNIRFPFDLYKIENWDIEHIRSLTDKDLKGNDCKVWCNDMLEYFSGFDNQYEQQEYINSFEGSEKQLFTTISKEESEDVLQFLYDTAYGEDVDQKKFDEVYNKIRTEFKEENEPTKNAISNLALLDSSTNRSYKNAFFPIKRKFILQNDKQGKFIPICTKNVFMKAYSKRFDEVMYWNKDDAENYLKAIKETLRNYLPKQENHDTK